MMFSNLGSVQVLSGKLDLGTYGIHSGPFSVATGSSLSFSTTLATRNQTFQDSSSISGMGTLYFGGKGIYFVDASVMTPIIITQGTSSTYLNIELVPGTSIQQIGASMLFLDTGSSTTLPSYSIANNATLVLNDDLTITSNFVTSGTNATITSNVSHICSIFRSNIAGTKCDYIGFFLYF